MKTWTRFNRNEMRKLSMEHGTNRSTRVNLAFNCFFEFLVAIVSLGNGGKKARMASFRHSK